MRRSLSCSEGRDLKFALVPCWLQPDLDGFVGLHVVADHLVLPAFIVDEIAQLEQLGRSCPSVNIKYFGRGGLAHVLKSSTLIAKEKRQPLTLIASP